MNSRCFGGYFCDFAHRIIRGSQRRKNVDISRSNSLREERGATQTDVARHRPNLRSVMFTFNPQGLPCPNMKSVPAPQQGYHFINFWCSKIAESDNDSGLMDLDSSFAKMHLSNSSKCENGKRTSESSGSYTVSNSAARLTFNNQRSSRISSDVDVANGQESGGERVRRRPQSARQDRANRHSGPNLQVTQNKSYNQLSRIKIHQNIPSSYSAGESCAIF